MNNQTHFYLPPSGHETTSMATVDLMPSSLYTPGEDPRKILGDIIVPPNVVTDDLWLNYGSNDSCLRRGMHLTRDGYAQDGRIPHLMTSVISSVQIAAARYCRPVVLRNFTVPCDIHGWGLIEEEPGTLNDGLKVAFQLHNMTMLLAQVLRGNRQASMLIEDRHGKLLAEYDTFGREVSNPPYKSLVHPTFKWDLKTGYNITLALRQRWMAIAVDDQRILEAKSHRMPSSGMVGFRLDRTKARLGAWAVNER